MHATMKKEYHFVHSLLSHIGNICGMHKIRYQIKMIDYLDVHHISFYNSGRLDITLKY